MVRARSSRGAMAVTRGQDLPPSSSRWRRRSLRLSSAAANRLAPGLTVTEHTPHQQYWTHEVYSNNDNNNIIVQDLWIKIIYLPVQNNNDIIQNYLILLLWYKCELKLVMICSEQTVRKTWVYPCMHFFLQ